MVDADFGWKWSRAGAGSLAIIALAAANVRAAPSLAGSDGEAALSAPLRKETLTRAVIARSPGVHASEQRARAMQLEARAEGSLPPPEVMAQVWQVPLSRPLALDTQMIMVGVSQSFPAPGALGAREEAQAARAEGQRAQATDRGRMLAREAGHAFVDYAASTWKHRIHGTHQRIARHLLDVAEARHASGGSLADAARAEVELSRTFADLLTDATLVESARARLNALLGRDPKAPLGEPVETEPELPRWDVERLLTEAHDARPELEAARAEQQARSLTLRAASREATWPSFSLGALYFPPTRSTPSHGYGASAAVNLPWLWGGAEHRRAAEERYAEAAGAEVDAARISIDTEVVAAVTSATSAASRFQVLHDRTLPASQRALEVTQAGYESGRTDLMAVLDARRAVADVEQDIIMTRSTLEHALTDLDAAVGKTVPTRPLGPEDIAPVMHGGDHAP